MAKRKRKPLVDPATIPEIGRTTRGGASVRVLGDRTRKAKTIGLGTQTQDWHLDKTELKDLQYTHAKIALEELQVEQRGGSLHDYNRFVDLSQFKTEKDVKLGGVITYDEVSALADMMLFVSQQLFQEFDKFRDTGALRDSARWVHNSSDVKPDGVPILDRGDQLIVYGDIRYAKYQESGTVRNKARWVYRKVTSRARRRYGRGYIVEHKFIQNASLLGMKKIRKTKIRGSRTVSYSAYTKEYYKFRWEQSFPAIKITQRQGVKFRVQ